MFSFFSLSANRSAERVFKPNGLQNYYQFSFWQNPPNCLTKFNSQPTRQGLRHGVFPKATAKVVTLYSITKCFNIFFENNFSQQA